MRSSESVIESLSGFSQSVTGRYPVAELLANHIKDLIATGGLAPGTEIPGVRELSAVIPVSYVNIQKALSICSKEGLLARCPGRKTVVSAKKEFPLKKCVYLIVQHTEEEYRSRDYISGEYFSSLISGIQSELTKHGSLVMAMSIAGPAQEELLLSRISVSPPDLVLIARAKGPAIIHEIQKKGVPAVMIEPHTPENDSAPVIMHDHERQAADIAVALHAAGARNTAVLFRDDKKWITHDRLRILLARLKTEKISVPSQWMKFIKQGQPEDKYRRAASEIFASANKPDSVIISGFGPWLINAVPELSAPDKKTFVVVYSADEKVEAADHTVSLDPAGFGVAVGKLVMNNFLRQGGMPEPRKYFVM
jgi:DNA-binding transcriptional regulator YhcF (GntR family)